MSDRTESDMSSELFEPDKSPVQLNPDFWLEPMSRTLHFIRSQNSQIKSDPTIKTSFIYLAILKWTRFTIKKSIVTKVETFVKYVFLRLLSFYSKKSGSKVRCRSPVDSPVYVRLSSAQKFRAQVAHYLQPRDIDPCTCYEFTCFTEQFHFSSPLTTILIWRVEARVPHCSVLTFSRVKCTCWKRFFQAIEKIPSGC